MINFKIMPIINLEQKDAPTHYYNIIPDLPKPLSPPLHPATKKPIGPDDLAAIFPMELIKQEVSMESKIDIPEEVQKAYQIYRPSPLIRASRLEKELDTPAKIYYKYEGVSPTGSHKPNTAIAQAYYNKKAGIKKLTTETGAGQWGSALSFACNLFGLECLVYMVKASYDQKPYRRIMMNIFGAECVASPSDRTESGRKILAKDPNTPGSLGMAISEAVEEAAKNDGTNYSLGSVLNHVLLHQTIIGLEAKKQLEKVGDYPDIIIGCHGGGSNFAGISFPFLRDKLKNGKKNLRAIAVEPKSCPSLTEGRYDYDFGDTVGLTPLLLMFTLGHDFVPPPIHAGGLRYHGAAPIVSLLHKEKVIEALAYDQLPVFEAAMKFARNQGIIPAPESAHAIKAVFDEAEKCKQSGEEKTILFNLSGHGHFDMTAYQDFLAGKLSN
ncbi:MAG: TrpB-like pyridoxal-phosphate dependent enzyme [Candidatus Buchananbacteria bacterium RIFCSPHIGHO2_01_FULL_44_11]|uniref:Tryptophan synthase beta chain n=1 Tax=Candidatus Buchananbacteria bacterium RIFCSPHIGHO2_01_FULL_44_11 TaxID=1797535 RepID=A0A1G1Y202_9BACT|nr:MAG: TrpB-like pyridoxal-phosphate dependent enzyme [Candidatus Buchananbacteria bacterium RIFCSPHIGHO2_01_FULL_44_11]